MSIVSIQLHPDGPLPRIDVVAVSGQENVAVLEVLSRAAATVAAAAVTSGWGRAACAPDGHSSNTSSCRSEPPQNQNPDREST